MTRLRLTAKLVRDCQSEDAWSLGNDVLYDLCRSYPKHTAVSEIVAKVWLIGRAYSASVERGRGDAAGAGLSNDDFYTKSVAPALRRSDLDTYLDALARSSRATAATVEPVLATHGHLVAVLRKLTGKDKRSFASKYLHFHRPSHFFIYDSRAINAIRRLGRPRTRGPVPPGADPTYAAFVTMLLALGEEISARFGVSLTPRQLDRLLLLVDAA